MDSIITVNNISFFYKNLQALKDISFLVNPGDFIALMGVNGAGKYAAEYPPRHAFLLSRGSIF